MTSNDRMDRLVAAAVRSGFNVRQTPTGAWHFRKGFANHIFFRTPIGVQEWIVAVNTLKGDGLVLPPVEDDEGDDD